MISSNYRRWARPRRLAHRVLPVVVALSAACAEPAPPVAVPAVTADRVSVPLGAPLELTFRFDVLPTPDPIPEDYRVLVHFLDTDEDLLWTEDHEPPVPTHDWEPGRTITYTRRVILPMYPYRGDAIIAVGLYSPSTNQRLSLSGQDLGQRAYRVGTVRLEPMPESSFLTYRGGWHPAEVSPDDPHQQWRWTAQEAAVTFRNPRTDAVLYVDLAGRPDLFPTPQEVSVVIDGRVVHRLMADRAERTFHRVPLSAPDLGTGNPVSLALRIDKTFVPSKLPGESATDDRELGIRVFYVFVEPAG